MIEARPTPPDPGSPPSLRVSLIDLTGETNIRYLPLAVLGLQAAVEADERLASRVHVTVHSFTQGDSEAAIVLAVLRARPEVVGFSCQGWNVRQLMSAARSLHQFLPEAMFVAGGNHVSFQGHRWLRAVPELDVIVNGEGEFTFCDLLASALDGGAIGDVPGLTIRDCDGSLVTTPPRPRTRSMTELPSPYRLQNVDYASYDVALLETNRGRPYACSFCYWGGRIGEKIAKGELERVRVEFDVIGRAGIPTVFLCDANFGILPQDVEVARIAVETYRTHGAPRLLDVNWAKNHAERVGEIISILHAGGVRTTINVPLQTLSLPALELAGRSRRGRTPMIALAEDLIRSGTEVYCELIFGLPGESLSDFRRHYDRLYLQFPSLRIHPLWVLPNTEYDRRREELGIRTISPDPTSDYEAVLCHRDLSVEDMQDGLAMLLAHEMLNHLGLARHTLRLLAYFDDRSPSDMVCGLEPFLRDRNEVLASELGELFVRIRHTVYFERVLRWRMRHLLFRSRQATHELMAAFIDDQPLSAAIRDVAHELLRFECLLLPRSDVPGTGVVTTVHDFSVDPVELGHRLAIADPTWRTWLNEAARPTQVRIEHRAGITDLLGRDCYLSGWNGRVVGVE